MRFPRVPRIVPTRRFAILTAATAPVWLLSDTRTGMIVAIGTVIALILAIVADTFGTPAPTGMDVRREAPQTVGIGDESKLLYELHSRWPGKLRGALFDQM